jgi:NhaA family Na+:H+ antiporter
MDNIVFDRPSLIERAWVLRILRQETVGGLLMLAAAAVAFVWANTEAATSYVDLISIEIGPEALHLNLTLATWAADFLLAFFFFLAGLELKHEVAHGSLSNPSQAVVPVVAAAAGMAVPALIYVAFTFGRHPDSTGWGIPMATDIAFALAVLAIMGRGLPLALRAFLLTLAVVDDLGAITVIAVFYSDVFHPVSFLAALACVGAWALLQHRRVTGGVAISLMVYLPLGLLTWYFTHESGVHATVAGVALGLVTRVSRDVGERSSPAERAEVSLRPFVSGFCVPVFAFTAAGVTIRDVGLPGQQVPPLTGTLTSPVALGVFVGLLIGKPLGVFGGAWLMARFTRAQLNPALRWADIGVVGLLAGIGFTVSLLITELAFEDEPTLLAEAKIGVLAATLAAAFAASIALAVLRHRHAGLVDQDEADDDADGIPDAYQDPSSDPGHDGAR